MATARAREVAALSSLRRQRSHYDAGATGQRSHSHDRRVFFRSSHLDGAKSELIVNSDHGAQYNQQAIREVERILRVNLARSND